MEVGNWEFMVVYFHCGCGILATGIGFKILAFWNDPGLAGKKGQCSEGLKPMESSVGMCVCLVC